MDTSYSTPRRAIAPGIGGEDMAIAAERLYAGFEIEGHGITIEIYPGTDDHTDGAARVYIAVGATPALTGFDRACRLSSDLREEFTLDDIRVDDANLTCLAPSRYAPAYRQGFSVALEPGMAALVRQALARVARVSTVARATIAAVEARMPSREDGAPRLWPHHRSVIVEVVADVLLDGTALDRAVEMELAPYKGDETAFRAAIADPVVQQLINE